MSEENSIAEVASVIEPQIDNHRLGPIRNHLVQNDAHEFPLQRHRIVVGTLNLIAADVKDATIAGKPPVVGIDRLAVYLRRFFDGIKNMRPKSRPSGIKPVRLTIGCECI